MTCERHYTPTAIAEMQQIAAGIEAERRRQYRAEMAQELRGEIAQVQADWQGTTLYDYGVVDGLEFIRKRLDELSPPVVCDEDEKEER